MKNTSWSQLCRKLEKCRIATRHFVHSQAHSKHSCASFHLAWRGVVRVSGRDTVDFLQGLVTNDLTQLCMNQSGAMYSMMLNIQVLKQISSLIWKCA